MADAPIALDDHRGLAAQRATDIRRRLAEVDADRAALRQRRSELETFLVAAPATSWREAADKARYLLTVLSETAAGREPRRQKIIASVLEDFRRLGDSSTDAPASAE